VLSPPPSHFSVLGSPLAFLGVGVQTYEPTIYSQVTDLKNHYAQQVFGAPWKDLGPTAQKVLRAHFPQIDEIERMAKAERTNYDFQAQIVQRQMDAGRRIFNALPDSVRDEMKALGVTMGGIGDVLSRKWRLNQERYEDYQRLVKALSLKVLPKIVKTRAYQLAPRELKVLVLEQVIDRIKKAARTHIIARADISDLERLQ